LCYFSVRLFFIKKKNKALFRTPEASHYPINLKAMKIKPNLTQFIDPPHNQMITIHIKVNSTDKHVCANDISVAAQT